MPGQLIGRLLGLPAYRDKTTALVLSAQQTIYRAIIVLLTVTAILWMAVFLYVAFYYSYMPAISHTRPVHLQFESCGRDHGLCTFPTANVTLTRRQQLLMAGQPYKILVELEMPESRRNQDLGMFMICLDLKDGEKVVIDKSCRSAMLHYKSPLLQSIMTTLLAPVLISGSAEEKQIVSVELFSGFEEDPLRPVTVASIQVQSQHVEVYKVYLRIHAHFTGLRYFMFYWPVLSGFLGITSNLFFLSVIALLSYFKFFQPKQIVVHVGYDASAARTLEERRALAKEKLMRERSKLVHQKIEPNEESASASTTKEGLEQDYVKPDDTPPNQGKKAFKDTEVKKEDDRKTKDDIKSKDDKKSKDDEEDDEENNDECRRSSEDYEVISKDGDSKEHQDEDEEEFSELDVKSSGKDEETEEDKENIPSTSKIDDDSSSSVRLRKV